MLEVVLQTYVSMPLHFCDGGCHQTASRGVTLEASERERDAERRESQAVGDLALLDERPHVVRREPRDALRLGAVEVADMLGARRDVVLEALLHQAVRRMAEAEVLEVVRAPPRLLDRLADTGLLGRLARVDAPGGDLPAPRVVDEAVAPQQEHATLRVAHDHADRRMRQPHDVARAARPGR